MCTEIDKHCEIGHKRLLMSSIKTENQLSYCGSTIVYPFGFCEKLAAETPAVEKKMYVFKSHTDCVQKGIDKKL